MSYTLFISEYAKSEKIKNITAEELRKRIAETVYENDCEIHLEFHADENSQVCAVMQIYNTNEINGREISLAFFDETERQNLMPPARIETMIKLSLFDENQLSEIAETPLLMQISKGLFLPKELAYEVILDFFETGKASDKIRWITPEELPEDGNYIFL